MFGIGGGQAYVGSHYVPFSGPSSTDADVQSYIMEVYDQGATMTQDSADAYTGFVTGLKTDGLWTKFDRLGVFWAENSISALLCLKSKTALTPVNSPTFITNTGFDFPLDNFCYINSNYNLSTGGGVYAKDSAHFSYFALENEPSSAVDAMGAQSGDFTAASTLGIGSINSSATYRLNATNTANIPGPDNRPIRQYIASRTGSTTLKCFINGAVAGTNATPSLNIPNLPVFVGGYNFGGNLGLRSDITCGLFSIGSGLSDTEAANFYSRCETFRTAMAA